MWGKPHDVVHAYIAIVHVHVQRNVQTRVAGDNIVLFFVYREAVPLYRRFKVYCVLCREVYYYCFPNTPYISPICPPSEVP